MAIGLVTPKRFTSAKNERECRDEFLEYVDQVKNGDATPVGKKGAKYIAAHVDRAAEKVLNQAVNVLQKSPEHPARAKVLKDQPTLVGKSSSEKAILKETTPFEQTVALCDWLKQTKPKTTHTFCFANGDDYIPVAVKKGTLMTTVLGATSGSHKAPKYSDWALKDPLKDANQKIFVDPLESLEIMRQPFVAGASIVKGSAYYSGMIDCEWRYGQEMACVEDGGQSRHSQKKLISTGLNLTHLLEITDLDDESNMAIERNWEDYGDDKYKDEDHFELAPIKLLWDINKAVVKKNDIDLVTSMEKLFITRIDPPATPALKAYCARKLFD